MATIEDLKKRPDIKPEDAAKILELQTSVDQQKKVLAAQDAQLKKGKAALDDSTETIKRMASQLEERDAQIEALK